MWLVIYDAKSESVCTDYKVCEDMFKIAVTKENIMMQQFFCSDRTQSAHINQCE